MNKISPLKAVSPIDLPKKMKIPKAFDKLMAEHAKSSYVDTPSYKMAEVFRTAGDMVMSWFWSDDVQKFIVGTDVDIVPFEVKELPFENMFFEFERGDCTHLPMGCFITAAGDHMLLQPVVFAKWSPMRSPYWGYICESYMLSQKDISRLPEWLQIDYDNKALSINYTDQDDELGVHVLEWKGNGQLPDFESGLAKHCVATTLHFLTKLLVLLECNNAPVELVEPSALKKRMARSSRKPIPRSYRILKLTSEERRQSMDMSRQGSSISVRTHLRRGHIRNVKTARGHVRRWIKPCIVNADKADQIIKETVFT